MISICNVTKRYGDLLVLDGFSHDLAPGKITALVGPNGSGKTTLFNLIIGSIRPDSGKIYLSGMDMAGLHTHQIAGLGISIVFQHCPHFKNLTIREHLLLCDNQEEKFRSAMKLVGLDKSLDDMVCDLSFGQKRLMGFAMALLREHKILLLDEPVAGVSHVLKQEIKGILMELKRKGETIFLIEHDLDFVYEVADEIIVLQDGKALRNRQ